MKKKIALIFGVTGQDGSYLAKLLIDKGYNLARRTVAKYRDQLGLPVARLRKEI